MDQLQALRVFARVVEAGTFTRAADSLQMPKATVSKLVQSLESHLRVKLLNRTTRQVTVTAEGAAYYERTSRLLTELEEIDTSLGDAQVLPKGRIRVDVPAAFARQIVIPGISAFHQRYPDIQIDLGVGDRLVDLVADNVDCVIRGGKLRDDTLIARQLGEIKFITCAAPRYIEQHGIPSHPAELEKDHLIVAYFPANGGSAFPLDFTREGERIEILGRYVVAVNDSNAYMAAGLVGLGIFQTTSYMAREHLASGELVEILSEWSSDPTPVYAVYPPNRRLSAKVRVFVDWMADVFSRLDVV